MKISVGDLAYAFTFFGFPGVNDVVEAAVVVVVVLMDAGKEGQEKCD